MLMLSSLFPKVFKSAPFWKRFFVATSKKVINHYCVTTPAKVIMYIIRMNCVGYGFFTFGYPSIEAICSNRSIWLSLKWTDTDWKLTFVFVAINALLGVVYLITQRYGGLETKEAHERQEKQHQEQIAIEKSIQKTVEHGNSGIQTIMETLACFPSPSQSIIIRNIRDTQKDIENLRLKAALNHLKGLREQVDEHCPDSIHSLAKLEYWEACCIKYSDTKQSVAKYAKAYSLYQTSNIPKEIAEGYVFALCFEGDFNKAQQIVDLNLSNEVDSCWKYIPLFLNSSNKQDFFVDNHINNNHLIETILGESIMLLQKHNQQIKLNQFSLEPNVELELTYNTFSIWVLYLSYALSDFMSDLYLPFNKDKLSSDKSEMLYTLCTNFLKKDESHDIKGVLPDIELYHAFTGYLHDGDPGWINKLKEQLNNCHDKDMAHMFLSFVLFHNNQKSEAIQLLKDFSSTNHNLDWTLMSMLVFEGLWDDIENLMQNMIKQQLIEVPPFGYHMIINVVRIFPERFSILAQEFTLQDKKTDLVFKKFILFFEGDSTVIEFLIEHESDASNTFANYYPLVYEAKGDLETALRKTKELLLSEGINENTIRYASLLEKTGKDKELLVFLRSIRKKGIRHTPFLYKELHMAFRIHDHNASVEICDELKKLYPDDIPVMYNSIMSYYHAGKVLMGRNDLIEKLKNAKLGTIEIQNIFNVLINENEPAEALDFLYCCIKNSTNQDLRDFFYQVHLDEELGQLIDKDKTIVEEGDYIEYYDGSITMSSEIRANSLISEFIGKTVGATIQLNLGVRLQTFTLTRIQSKYAGLVAQIALDIQNNLSSSIRCFSFDDIKDNPIEGLKKVTEAYRGVDTDTYNRSLQQQIQKYYNGECPIGIAKGKTDLKGLYELLFGDFKIIQKPYLELKSRYSGLFNNPNVNIVLDLSSLILIHAITKKTGINITHKFIISQRTYDYLRESALASKRSPQDVLYGKNITTNLDQFKSINDNPLYLSSILSDLLQWIKLHCEIQIAEEMIDCQNDEMPPIMEIHLESILLSQKPNNILVSEDVWMFNHYESPCVVNTEFIFNEIGQNSHIISNYFTALNYVGHNISGDFIIEQILLKECGNNNSFEYCLETLKHNPYVLSNLMSVSYKLESGFITPQRFNLLEQVFYTIFLSLGYERALYVFNQIQTFPITKLVRHSFENAFNRLESQQIIKRPSSRDIII